MFTFITLVGPALLVPMLAGAGAATACQLPTLTPLTFDQKAVARFDQAVDQYAGLHRRLARSVGLMGVEGDEDDSWYVEALRTALRAARPNAARGDLFNADVADLLRFRLETALMLNAFGTADVLVEAWRNDADVAARPTVHGEFVWNAGGPAWTMLIWELPPLPDELAYRFVGRDLVLLDIDANMVVDVLEHALPVR
jgi:hypothetical protein